MTELLSNNTDKYQGVASQRIISAVAKAAHRTGADFSSLMNKAATESSFNPAAKSKSSSATGLFQFIDSTWLKMVKTHGAKYGLENFAKQIEMKDGKACVGNCKVKDAILNLRKNPELSALMAGEFSTENKRYLENNTQGTVGETEIYLAHFMGAGGAAKFLNQRHDNPDSVASQIFPKAAHANKAVFFDSETGRPRTLNQIYDFFANKLGGQTSSPAAGGAVTSASVPDAVTPAAVASMMTTTETSTVQNNDEIIWNDAPVVKSGFSHHRAIPSSPIASLPKLSPVNMMMLAEMQDWTQRRQAEKSPYNS
jgi:hypothetical protein